MDGAVSGRTYRTVDIEVAGGALRVGVWDDGPPHRPTVLAVHGITSSHLAFAFLAEHLPGVRVVAPDLRGRGRSNSVAGPAGLRAHADDLAATLDHLDIDRAVVVGHSMGAFVAVVFARMFPERVSRLVLVDGGLPLDVPAGLDADTLVSRVLGPTAARLSMRFSSHDDYRRFWREHPAFRHDWSPQLEAYLDYDLVPVGDTDVVPARDRDLVPGGDDLVPDGGSDLVPDGHSDPVPDSDGALRPATSYATTVEDTVDLYRGSSLPDALASLRHPARLLTAPRGLQDEAPGLYSSEYLDQLLPGYPGVRHERLDSVNHYTIVLSDAGAAAVAAVVREQLAQR